MIGDQIPSEVQHALRSMRSAFEGEADVARREYVRKCLKNHEFFRGNAWYWWDYGWGSYRSFIGNAQIGDKLLEQVQSLYVVNIFQPFALALISLLASNKLTQKFWPFDPNDPGDVAAAKKHDVVFRAFQKGERRHDQLVKAIYHLWCDGTFGSYVRTVQDAERFGYLEEPEYQVQQVPIGNGSWKCPICEHQQAEGGQCQACEAPLPAQPNVPAPVMSRQKKVGVKKIARAQVARDVVGGLELKLPPMAEAQHAFPYLIRSRELPRSSVRSAYPELASKIVGSSSPADGSSTGNYERRARIQASGGSTVDGKPTVPRVRDIVTFTEVWFRKTAFYQIDDEHVRKQMLDMFPDGAYCSFADDLLCEVRNESMDDHWRVCHALPGRGQLREPIGAALVPLQEMINDLANIFRDIIEFGIPATFIDKQVLDVESWQRSRVMGGAAYNVTRRGQTPVQDGFFQTAPGSMPEYATRFFDLLRTDLAQFVTGTFSAAMGGDTGGNNTAQGIETQRNAALSRISIFLQRLSEHYADFAPLVIREFRKSGVEPMVLVDQDRQGKLISEKVTPQDLRDSDARVIVEVNEEYPTTWPQKQALLMQLMGMPLFQNMVTLLTNADSVKSTLGFDLKMPGFDAYQAEFRIIRKLLAEAPIDGEPQPVLGPDGQPQVGPDGQPQMEPGAKQPSIPVMPYEDNASMLQACQDFYYSQEGREAQEKNPTGWENFILHFQARQEQSQPPAPAPGEEPPPGA